MTNMKDFFKYLTPSEEDKKWGFYLNVAGRAAIPAGSIYPSLEHPTGYYFTWKKGRILDEYQLIYITEGQGVLKVTNESYDIRAGSILLIKPELYHRYKPNEQTGWRENYIGFNGNLVKHFYEQAPFIKNTPILHIGIDSALLDLYFKIFKLVQEERPGFQQIASGLILQVLGKIIAYHKQDEFSGKEIEAIIQKVLLYMRENVEQNIDLQKLAGEFHISYASFRKKFKKYTGMAPRQYHIELKLLRAKELILTTDKPIQEISEELKFDSIHYFSRFFKKKLGYTPTELRKRVS